MNCRDVVGLLPLFLDEELAPAEMKKVSSHLATCSNCQQLLAEYKREQQILRSLPPVAPPPTWRAELMQRVHCQQRTSAWRFFVPRLGSLAAALLVVLLVTNLYVFPSYVLDTPQDTVPQYGITVSGQSEILQAPLEHDGEPSIQAAAKHGAQADDFVSVASISPNDLQWRWWLWSSSLCLVIWLAGATYYYYRYRRLQEQNE